MKKIFFIGLHKTGTSTITKTLKSSGINCLHNPAWNNWAKNKNKERLLRNDAYCDGWTVNYEWLDNEFDAYFVLNTRNLKSWLISRWNHRNRRNNDLSYLRKRGITKLPNSKNHVINWIRERNEYHKEVLSYFENRDNFITLDITSETNQQILSKLSKVSQRPIKSITNANIKSSKGGYIKEPPAVMNALRELGISDAECELIYIDRKL